MQTEGLGSLYVFDDDFDTVEDVCRPDTATNPSDPDRRWQTARLVTMVGLTTVLGADMPPTPVMSSILCITNSIAVKQFVSLYNMHRSMYQ
jgi:hypothetical protein